MNRLLRNVLVILACTLGGAGIWAFSDYYTAIFGNSSTRRQQDRALNTVMTDTDSKMQSRAMWGAAVGARFLGGSSW